MKKELTLYYISRAALSFIIGFLLVTTGWPVWGGWLIGITIFGMFLWYAHSGHFLVDPSKPLTPLKRDARSKVIRDRALVGAVGIGSVLFAVTSLLNQIDILPPGTQNLALAAAVISYFVISQVLFARDAR